MQETSFQALWIPLRNYSNQIFKEHIRRFVLCVFLWINFAKVGLRYGMQMMRDGICSEEACVLYSELLTDFERVGDHVLNIGQSYAKIYGKM